jgi:hypothetical protein
MVGGRVHTEHAIAMLRTVDKRANEALLVAVGAMAHETKALCIKLVSADDHTLAQLAALGHPYAKRSPQAIHDPIEQVHQHKGELVAGMTETRPVARKGRISARVYNSAQPLDTWIQNGTRTMVARPYMAFVRRAYHKIITGVGMAVIKRYADQMKRSA